jgi:FtsP/CotA-like multicopper oxidase with cupredoxin domain
MTRRTRIGLLGAAAVVAIVAVVIAIASGGGDNNDNNETTNTTTGGATASAPAVTQIRVVNGKPVGGVTKIKVKKGDQVRLNVSSDVADEIHVHGYDFMKDVKAGGHATFAFKADIDGVFEIELENRKEQIASLQVEP